MTLGRQELSTAPDAAPVHWSPAFLPLDPPLPFERGEKVTFALRRAPRGDWTWSVRCRAGRQQHSTLLAMPMTSALLRRARVEAAPELGADGRLLRDVLDLCDGVRTTDDIAEALRSRYVNRFTTHDAALSFVQHVLPRYL
jgi:hypothetical protein